jgi:hypothetical protein
VVLGQTGNFCRKVGCYMMNYKSGRDYERTQSDG